jgi:hypothetical protein
MTSPIGDDLLRNVRHMRGIKAKSRSTDATWHGRSQLNASLMSFSISLRSAISSLDRSSRVLEEYIEIEMPVREIKKAKGSPR